MEVDCEEIVGFYDFFGDQQVWSDIFYDFLQGDVNLFVYEIMLYQQLIDVDNCINYGYDEYVL